MKVDFEINTNNKQEQKKVVREKLKTEKKLSKKDDLIELSDCETIMNIPLSKIIDNPFQPRRSYNKERIMELALTIKKDGLLQPISVVEKDGKYVTRYGHRRIRAAKLLKEKYIKAIIYREKNAETSFLSSALIENLQIDAMDAIDTALSFKQALDLGLYSSQASLSKAIGKDTTYVSKALKILTLPEDVIKDLMKNKSIKDRVVLDLIRRIKVEDECREIYFWFVKNRPTRKELKEKINSLLSKEEEGDTIQYKIKNTKNGLIINLPKLDNNQQKSLESFINKLLVDTCK